MCMDQAERPRRAVPLSNLTKHLATIDPSNMDVELLMMWFPYSKVLDIFELAMQRMNAKGNTAECPLEHTFTPGLYTRQIFMPARSVIVSKIHKTEHPFIISKGRVSVWTDEGVQELSAPHQGITKPGTRRLLVVHEDTIWTTFHAGPENTPEEFERRIIQKHTPTLPDGVTFMGELL